MKRAASSALLLALTCAPAIAAPADEPPAVRDAQYHLDVAEQRIDRGPYDASLEVGLARPSVRVGVALSASHLIVLLRGVHGDVRFRGDLSRLTRIAASHSPRGVSAKENP